MVPPNLREWLPDDHFAWFVLNAVEAMDLQAFYAAYRADGHGRAAHDPRTMVALLFYAYAKGERSSRQIAGGNRRPRAHPPGLRTIERGRSAHGDGQVLRN